VSTTSIPPMSPARRSALSKLQDQVQEYMEMVWTESGAVAEEDTPFLMDFAMAVQVRTVDPDGTITDAYAVIRNAGQAPHITKGILNEGIETIQEEQMSEEDDE
jgi:hypothetical protein